MDMSVLVGFILLGITLLALLVEMVYLISAYIAIADILTQPHCWILLSLDIIISICAIVGLGLVLGGYLS
jgi:hypothetical protein